MNRAVAEAGMQGYSVPGSIKAEPQPGYGCSLASQGATGHVTPDPAAAGRAEPALGVPPDLQGHALGADSRLTHFRRTKSDCGSIALGAPAGPRGVQHCCRS
eukprot:1157491-Pelagomonas_calceolata.AAC.1